MDGVVVLGAGLSGLGCALELPEARVFEAKAHAGGHAFSHDLAGVAFDEGAHICHSQDHEFLNLLAQAQTPQIHISPSIVRNAWHGQWLNYPVQNHLRDLPVDLRIKSLSDVVQAFAARESAPPPENYRRWCLQQYGATLTDEFYDKFTTKYWRVRMEDLATDWLGGRLLPSQLERVIEGAFRAENDGQAVFSRFRYPARGGFFSFFAELYERLPIALNERAIEIDTIKQQVTFSSGRCESYQALASSIPLTELVRITKDLPPALRSSAAKLRHTQLLCVNMIVNRPALSDCHWFYIYDEDIDAARVSFPGRLSPGTVPTGRTALQAEIFRRNDESLPIDVLTERTVAQMAKLLNFEARDVAAVAAVPVRYSYIISDHQRAATVAQLCEWFEARDIFPIGLYGRWKYMWSDAAWREGRRAAAQISARFSTTCAA